MAAVDQAVTVLTPAVGTAAACRALGRPRASHYRAHRQSEPPPSSGGLKEPRGLSK